MRTRRAPRTGRARLLRAAAAGAAATGLASALSGCVTVHGEAAVIPATSKGEASAVLRHFTATSNRANKTYDAGLNATVEAGSLGAIDQAGLKSRKAVRPQGAENYRPMRLTDAHFLIPRQAGWPKFFVADAKSNRSAGGRWLLAFAKADPDARWKATYLSVVPADRIPRLAKDAKGHVKPVPTGGGSGLAVAPGRLSRSYVAYLKKGGGDFAPGDQTSARLKQRKKSQKDPERRIQFGDVPAQPPQYAPFALRTEDGGALAFFGSMHHTRETYPRGYPPKVKDPLVKALLTGKPQQTLTYVRMSQQSVLVPPRGSDRKIRFLNRIDGLTAVKGE